jgi:Tol biopolymer transport system component
VPQDGGLPKKITDFASAAGGPRWMPDSHGLIVTVEREDTDQLLLTDREGSWPRALTTDTIGDHWDARPSPDGKFILYNLRRFDDLNRLDIVLLEIATGKQVTLYGKPSTRATTPKWSPDGKWISFIAQEGQFEELYLIKPDGEGLHQLTKAGQDIFQYEWSPSGNQIIAVVNNKGSFELNLIDAESGSTVGLRSEVGIHSNPNWSADESYITFEFESPTLPPDLYRMELKSKQVTQLTFSNPPAMQKYKFVVPEIVSYKSYDGLEIPAFLYRPEKSNGAAICIRMVDQKTSMVLHGMKLRNISPQRDIPISRRTIAARQATARILSAPITTTGASATQRIACTARNICKHSKT